ncbi:MAG: TaqI-like C-terminal specificity domain-containing protein [Candidatus Thermoplasmatota archaeon]|nr:TaqI-like C-terminal specificity domain-containing protein [Candidatus Thermoplasmatota archaeon]
MAGEDIQRYKINWDGQRYVDYSPNEMKKKKTARPGEPERFEQDEKIVFQRYSSTRLIAALDTAKFYTLGTTIIARSTSEYSNRYILGLVNSKLLSWWYGRTFTSPTNYIREFESIPIRKIDFDNKNNKIVYDKITKSVDEKLVQKEQTITKKINKIDEIIDQLVYELYGLNKKEIKLIEESLKN